MRSTSKRASDQFAPRLALVTGATSGLGTALCTLLSKKNIPLIITGRSKEKLLKLQTSLPVHTIQIVADLSNRDSRATLIDQIKQLTPDLIINNAGFGLYGNGVDLDITSQLDMLETNGAALLEISLTAAQALIKASKPGTILNISSAAANFPFPGFAVYAASKAFVKQLSLALNTELSPQGVRVLTACPGQIITNFRKTASGGKTQTPSRLAMTAEKAADHLWRQIVRQTPLTLFDWKTRFGTYLFRLFPAAFRSGLLHRSILKRVDRPR
jgi:uncharacterized protein